MLINRDILTMGVIGTSKKENEHRVPIHPSHFRSIDESLRKHIFIEKGYGKRFNIDDQVLESSFAGVMKREELFEECDIILLPKPDESDFPLFREGQILWGWPHCVQGEVITQLGIDKKMTFIAWESMFLWKSDSIRDVHIFHRNNEMAGYCSVVHALQLAGLTGHYGTKRNAAVIGFGSTGRGAVHALRGQGYTDITIFSQRPYHAIQAPISSVRYLQYGRADALSPDTVVRKSDGSAIPMAEALADYDLIVNCILQDTDHPVMFIKGQDINRLKKNTIIIDVSCDNGMGFDFAQPTSFEHPSFDVSRGITYYGVDHTPSFLWNSASYEISSAVIHYIDVVMRGRAAWEKDITIRKAIEIENGSILNPKILRYQKRSERYPHQRLE